jgi:isochorismate hydrolase
MSEEQTQVTEQEVVTNQESTSAPDLGELIAESKKYRSRAQKAEAKLVGMEQSIETDRQKRLEEQDQWKVIAEEQKMKIEKLTPIVERYEADDKGFREELLSGFSEEDQETFKGLPTKELRAVHNKFVKQNVKVVDTARPGSAKMDAKGIKEVDPKDRNKSWGSILDSYRN